MKKTHNIALLAMTVAVAMVLSFVESRIPLSVSIPGIKIGLANIAVVFALYKFGAKQAVTVSLIRVLLISLLFGKGIGFFYGLAGAVLSLTVMFLLKRFSPLSAIGVSVAGGVAHNVGQVGIAAIIVQNGRMFYYLPYLLISGILAGIVVGILAGILTKRLSPKL